MRRLEVLDDLFLKFAGRDAEFELGFEIGVLTVLMAQGEAMLCRRIAAESLEQLRPIAERFGYSVIATAADDGLWDTSLVHRRYARPRLSLVKG